MKLNTVLTITAVLMLIFGLGNLVIPGVLGAQYGLEVNSAYVLAARVLAAALLGLAVMAWLARKAEPSPARDGLVLGLIVFTGLGAILHLVSILNGTMNAQGWGSTVLLGLLAVGFIVTGRASRLKT